MILSFNQIQGEWASIFDGHVLEEPDDWDARVPNDVLGENGFFNHILSDPRIVLIGASPEQVAQFDRDGLDDGDMFNMFWGQLAFDSFRGFVEASRQLLGEIVQSVGILSGSLAQLTNVFQGPSDKAIGIINVMQDMISDEAFAQGLDMVGQIPVIGWVVKIVVAVVKIVTVFFKLVRNDRDRTARAVAAKRLTLPISGTKFSNSSDEIMTQRVLRAFRFGELATQRLVKPPYMGELQAEGVYDDGVSGFRRDETMSLGWVIRHNEVYGGGFVPGTGNSTGSLFCSAGVVSTPGSHTRGPDGGLIRDLGSLYPTATALLNTWWSMVLKRGPSMFTVNPIPLVNDWVDYIYRMLKLGPNLRQGWSQAPTGIPLTNKFACVRGMGPKVADWSKVGSRRKKGVDGCKYGKRGKSLTLPSEWGLFAHLSALDHVYKLFFGLKGVADRHKPYDCDQHEGVMTCSGLPLVGNPQFYEMPHAGKWATPDSIDIDKCVPVLALQNLHERQVAVLQSLDAFYVNGENPEQFAAFAGNSKLVDRWTESITAILNTNDWRRVSFVNVPEGRAKEHLRRRAEQAGIAPESLNAPCPPGAPMTHPCRQLPLAMGPSVLGDPAPPTPPPSNDVEIHAIPVKPPMIARPTGVGGPSKKSGGGAGVLIAAAAVAAVLATRK